MLSQRILVADDEIEIRQGVEDLLAPLGLEILHAESGPEALHIVLVRRAPLHLMVLDMNMPGCSGLEVLSRVRSQAPGLELPCILFSGHATEELRTRALAAGARAFLRKPVEPALLRGEVLRALGRGGPPAADLRPGPSAPPPTSTPGGAS